MNQSLALNVSKNQQLPTGNRNKQNDFFKSSIPTSNDVDIKSV
jgi:hypothetical protein